MFSRETYVANAAHRFRDRDVKRVILATQRAGIDIGAVEVDPHTGTIRIIPNLRKADTLGRDDDGSERNPWDEVLVNAPDTKRPA
jgi:hypothetical protein